MRDRALLYVVGIALFADPALAGGPADDPVTLRQNDRSVYALAFSPDGRNLAAGCLASTAKIWQVPTGRETFSLAGHTGFVNTVAFLDPKRLASGGSDGTVRVWDAASGTALLTLNGHSQSVRCLAASADGRWLASGGQDSMVIVWDIARGGAQRQFRWPEVDQPGQQGLLACGLALDRWRSVLARHAPGKTQEV